MRVAVIALAAFALACSEQTTSPSDDLVLRTTVTPAAFRAGEPVTIQVTVTNSGMHLRQLVTNGSPSVFVVETGNGAVVGPARETCTLAAVIATLAPGEQYVWTQTWRGERLDGGVNQVPASVSPGAYRIRARLADVGPNNPPVSVTVVN